MSNLNVERINRGLNRGLTGILDQDREILFKIEDEQELLTVTKLNKYFYTKVCDDMFFRNRLERTYPDTMKYKKESETWKKYFIRTSHYIEKLKTEYEFNYRDYNKGNPEKQFIILKSQPKFSKDAQYFISVGSSHDQIAFIKHAMKLGADIFQDDCFAFRISCGQTFGTVDENIEVVKYFVSLGVNISLLNDYALIVSSACGKLELVKYLAENGADVSNCNSASLRAAAEHGHLEVVKYLFEKGSDIHALNDRALLMARNIGNIAVVKYLESLK